MEATFMHALPVHCFLSSEAMLLTRIAIFPKLQEIMTDEEIVSAHNEEQPALDKMREITCRPCNEFHCPLNKNPRWKRERKKLGLD